MIWQKERLRSADRVNEMLKLPVQLVQARVRQRSVGRAARAGTRGVTRRGAALHAAPPCARAAHRARPSRDGVHKKSFTPTTAHRSQAHSGIAHASPGGAGMSTSTSPSPAAARTSRTLPRSPRVDMRAVRPPSWSSSALRSGTSTEGRSRRSSCAGRGEGVTRRGSLRRGRDYAWRPHWAKRRLYACDRRSTSSRENLSRQARAGARTLTSSWPPLTRG